MVSWLKRVLKIEEGIGGILLILAALFALLLVNSPLQWIYDALLKTPVAIQIGKLVIAKPLLLWVNDGLMALFFFHVGLELKREFLEGSLSRPSQVILPGFAALGGMLLPALFYYLLNDHDPIRLNGWAIPAATDIAFALGIVIMLGKRVPLSLKIFLMALAILDDIGAIVIIALFYTSQLSISSLIFAGGAITVLFILNRLKVSRIDIYLLIGLVLWISVLKSGVHATLAGVVLAFMIPMRDHKDPSISPLKQLEHALHEPVAYFILPIFAFANAGIPLLGISLDSLLDPVTLGIIAGLFLGKQVGVFGFTWLVVKLGLAERPAGASWRHIYGVALLCGIGFTMSLFIGSLAFEHEGRQYLDEVRLAILIASLLSAVAGTLVLRFAPILSTGGEPAKG